VHDIALFNIKNAKWYQECANWYQNQIVMKSQNIIMPILLRKIVDDIVV